MGRQAQQDRLTPRAAIRRGMTLIEIMIVVALIAGIMTVAAVSFGVIGQSDVQGAALKFSAAIRYTFNLAATSNMTLQMKLDFENGTYQIEKLDMAGALSADELKGTTMQEAKSGGASAKKRRERASRMDEEDDKFGKVARTPIDDPLLKGDDDEGGSSPTLGDGVYFIGLMTSHHDDVQSDGTGTINFFSNGFVERSVIYLGDETAHNGDEGGVVYSISVNPLTGQSSVQPGRMEISSSFFEEEEDR